MRSLGLLSKTYSCEVNTLKIKSTEYSRIKDTVEHDVTSVLEGFRNYYATLADKLVKMLPKLTKKYSINTVIS